MVTIKCFWSCVAHGCEFVSAGENMTTTNGEETRIHRPNRKIWELVRALLNCKDKNCKLQIADLQLITGLSDIWRTLMRTRRGLIISLAIVFGMMLGLS